MAKNKKNVTAADQTKTGVEMIDKAVNSSIPRTQRTEKKSGKGVRRNRTNRRSAGESRTPRSNDTLKQFDAQTPTTGNSVVFPMDSYAMTSFGNRITTPGQTNFIQEWTKLYRTDDASDHPIVVDPVDGMVSRPRSVMVLNYVPYFGDIHSSVDDDFLSPMSLAAANLKQFIDTSFGTFKDYSAQDLIVYLMAVSAIFPVIAEIKRDLRLCYTYTQNQFPQFLPQGMFQALHICDDAGNLGYAGAEYTAENLRAFTDRLNQLILQFNRLPMPPEIVGFGYNDDLSSAFFLDSPDVQTAQMYAFKLSKVWVYEEELVENEGAALIPIPFHREIQDVLSVRDKLSMLSTMITKVSVLRTESSAMLQNLFNAYGSKDTVQVPLLDFTDMKPVDLIYDERILTMLENAKLCPSSTVEFTPIVASAEANAVVGHVFVKPNENAVINMSINLPLQFHRDAISISNEELGYAMRLHPMFLTQKEIRYWDVDGTPHTESRLTADGFTGFAFVQNATTIGFTDAGTLQGMSYASMNLVRAEEFLDFMDSGFTDFHTYPIPYTATGTVVDGTWHVKLHAYAAHRDVEVTFRQGDIELFWTYLTQTVWAANVNRNVVGSRIK